MRRACRLRVRSGSSSNTIEIFKQMDVQDAEKNSGSSDIAHESINTTRPCRCTIARRRVDCRAVPSVFIFSLAFWMRAVAFFRVFCSTFISRVLWGSDLSSDSDQLSDQNFWSILHLKTHDRSSCIKLRKCKKWRRAKVTKWSMTIYWCKSTNLASIPN
jgi:hypothetical protein